MDALASSVLPEVSRSIIGRVIRIRVGGLDVGDREVELVGDLGGPVGDELVLAGGLHAEDGLEVIETEVTVLVVEALGLVRNAKVHEVRHELVDLVCVRVVGQREGCVADGNLISDRTSEPWVLQKLLDDRVLTLASAAEVIHEDLELDFLGTGTDGVAGVGAVDGGVVGLNGVLNAGK